MRGLSSLANVGVGGEDKAGGGGGGGGGKGGEGGRDREVGGGLVEDFRATRM